MATRIFLLTLICFVNSEIIHDNFFRRENEMIMDELRDTRIDKDTVITLNLQPHKKNTKPGFNKKSYQQLDEENKLKAIKKMILSKNKMTSGAAGNSPPSPAPLPPPGKPAEGIISEPEIEAEPDWSYKPIPQEVAEYVHEFRKNMTECLKEVQDKMPVMQMSPKVGSPLNSECLIACVLRKGGVIENGVISKDHLIGLVSKFYASDTKLMELLENNVDHCIRLSSKIEDECKRAAYLNDCTNALINTNKQQIILDYQR